jgi:putative FmdB family regulatory protein
MPLYEYTCTICHDTFDKLRRISEMDDEANCPDCGGPSKRRLSVFVSLSVGAGGEVSPVAGGGGCCGGGAGGCACSMSA